MTWDDLRYLIRAVFVATLAAAVEALLSLGTGTLPPEDVALNWAVLVAAFLVGAAVFRSLYRGPYDSLESDIPLLGMSLLTFALRGCIQGCEGSPLTRVGIPTVLGTLALASDLFVRWLRAHDVRGPLILIAALLQTAAAIDFAIRDGVVFAEEVFAKVAVAMLVMSLVAAGIARRGSTAKLVAVVLFATGIVSASAWLVRPLWIEPPRRPVEQVRGTPLPFNLVLIVMDTVRADHLSAYGYGRRTSPHLEELARESVIFEHAVASGNYSLPSHGTLLTGALASVHGAHSRFTAGRVTKQFRRSDSALISEIDTIAERLGRRGFTTGGVSANYSYLARWTGLQRGFQVFDNRPKRLLSYHPFYFPLFRRLGIRGLNPRERDPWDAPTVTDAALHFAKGASAPFLLFANYLDAHDPYDPRRTFRFPFDPTEPGAATREAYDSEIALVDQEVGRLVSGLRKGGLLDRTVLLIVSDHGEFFGEHGFSNHKVGAYEEVVHVPAILRLPGVGPARVPGAIGIGEISQRLAERLDGHWSLSEFIPPDRPRVLSQVWGRVTNKDQFAGAQSVEPEAQIIYQGTHKLIARRTGRDEFYDLAADPSEAHNLLEGPQAPGGEIIRRVAVMRQALRELPPAREGQDPTLGPADVSALRGLGYITSRKYANR